MAGGPEAVAVPGDPHRSGTTSLRCSPCSTGEGEAARNTWTHSAPHGALAAHPHPHCLFTRHTMGALCPGACGAIPHAHIGPYQAPLGTVGSLVATAGTALVFWKWSLTFCSSPPPEASPVPDLPHTDACPWQGT